MREETSAHIVCKCEALASLRHAYLGSFFLEPESIKSISLGAIWNLVESQGSHDLMWGTEGSSLRPRCIGTVRSRTQNQLHNNTPGTTWFVWHRMRRRTVKHTVRVLEPVSWPAFETKVYVCPSLNIRKRSSTLCVVSCQPWV